MARGDPPYRPPSEHRLVPRPAYNAPTMTDDAPSVLLLWGDSAYLLRQAAVEAFGEVRPVEVEGPTWRPGAPPHPATPSLFGEERGLLITAAPSLPRGGVPGGG